MHFLQRTFDWLHIIYSSLHEDGTIYKSQYDQFPRSLNEMYGTNVGLSKQTLRFSSFNHLRMRNYIDRKN